jgi:hypothetical protein
MAYVGMIDGVRAYSAIGAEDERIINNQEILVADMKSGKGKRTGLQNSTMHLYFTMLSDALNAAGMTMMIALEILTKGADIPWSPSAIKERLWSKVQLNTYGTESTTKLGTDQVSVVYEALNQVTSEKLGVGVLFPDKFTKMYQEDLKCGR